MADSKMSCVRLIDELETQLSINVTHPGRHIIGNGPELLLALTQTLRGAVLLRKIL